MPPRIAGCILFDEFLVSAATRLVVVVPPFTFLVDTCLTYDRDAEGEEPERIMAWMLDLTLRGGEGGGK